MTRLLALAFATLAVGVYAQADCLSGGEFASGGESCCPAFHWSYGDNGIHWCSPDDVDSAEICLQPGEFVWGPLSCCAGSNEIRVSNDAYVCGPAGQRR